VRRADRAPRAACPSTFLVAPAILRLVLLPIPSDPEVVARVDRLELPFNAYGVDPYGISKPHVAQFQTLLKWLYRSYFRVRVGGLEHVPKRGRAMLVGNHSGGVAIDGAMVLASMLLDMEPPRLAQGMAEKFLAKLPFVSLWTSRCGQFTGLPEHAEQLLADERLLMVFPEGARGTAKLYPERHSLVNFGTGFVRLAMKMKTPIIPFGFAGGGEAVPTIANAYKLGRMFGVPYIPITPYLVALPLPVDLEIVYGAPMIFEGTGDEDDVVVNAHVERVKSAIADLIAEGVARRRRRALPARLFPGSAR
jgi:1-acyl-sn-glycerol-3-phosphate acyltransferase